VGLIVGRIWDEQSRRPLEARVAVLASTGHFRAPEDALLKLGAADGGRPAAPTGVPFFYSRSSFVVDVPGGPTEVTVERGTEYLPWRQTLSVPARGSVNLDVALERWINLPEQGWYAGNTHVHYPESESRPEERLWLDPRVEDLPVLVVSILKRRDERPASNSFPVGRHAFSDATHVIDIGEETRHNSSLWEIGLGHLLLINILNVVEPVGRGLLIDDSAPDYPPLLDACDEARRQGGVALWCHSGRGIEAPVASILGRLDGMNVFDPYWMVPEYETWYGLLNCGIRLPVSTGSDWYICSSNRVYVDTGSEFSYEAWLQGLLSGRTFATNGPVLLLSIGGDMPANDIVGTMTPRRSTSAEVSWQSAYPVDLVEIVSDGAVIARHRVPAGSLSGTFACDLDVRESGWVAARCSGASRTSFGQPLWAHTSPIYLREHAGRTQLRKSAGIFLKRLDGATKWITQDARFDNDEQRARMLNLFGEARDRFRALAPRAR
jgi:hypothetical protein